MPKNTLTSAQHAATVAQRIMEGGQIASSREEIGGVVPAANSREYIEAVSTHMGPGVLEAAGRIQEQFFANQEDPEDELDGEVDAFDGDPDPEEAPAAGYQPNAEDTALAVAASALVRRQEAGGAVAEPRTGQTWHRFTNLAMSRTQQNYMQNAATGLFRAFPCFGQIASREGNRAADQLKTVLRIQPQLNDPQMRGAGQALPAIQHQMRFNADDEVERVGRWIRQNALVLSSTSVQFPKVLPNYAPKIMFAVSEDETFLLVEENVGVADYSFSEDSGRIDVTVKDGKSLNNGDTLSVLDMTGLEEVIRQSHGFVTFNEGSDLSIVRTADNELSIIYTGDRTLSGGDRLTGRLEAPDDAFDQSLKETVSGKLQPVGVMDAGQGGQAPVDGKYIYSWPGGRRYYEQNPEKLAELVDLMTARESIEFTMDAAGLPRKAPTPAPALADRRQSRPAAQIEEAIAPADETEAAADAVEHVDPKPPEPEETPRPSITQARPRQAKPAVKPVKALAVLRNSLGFSLANTPARGSDAPVKSAVKEHETGGYVVITSADHSALPLAREFSIEHRTDLAEPGEECGRICEGMSPEEIETVISEAVHARAPRPT